MHQNHQQKNISKSFLKKYISKKSTPNPHPIPPITPTIQSLTSRRPKTSKRRRIHCRSILRLTKDGRSNFNMPLNSTAFFSGRRAVGSTGDPPLRITVESELSPATWRWCCYFPQGWVVGFGLKKLGDRSRMESGILWLRYLYKLHKKREVSVHKLPCLLGFLLCIYIYIQIHRSVLHQPEFL